MLVHLRGWIRARFDQGGSHFGDPIGAAVRTTATTSYLCRMALTGAVGFAVVWAWIIVAPMAFMDPEYASWRAKDILLSGCDIGDTVVLGDSRAAVDVLPNRLPGQVVNLAVGGGEAIEALAQARRLLACARPPSRVILSFDPGHFMEPDLLWERSVRYGLLSWTDLDDLREASRRTQDDSVYARHHIPFVPDPARDWLYRLRFPPFYFASLTHGGVVLRWWHNHDRLTATLASRGQYYFGTASGSDTVAAEGHLTLFRPLPVLDDAFKRLLGLLEARGIDMVFLSMPVNEATWAAEPQALRDGFAAYLARQEQRYRHLHVLTDMPAHWPNRYFGDQFCHLNPAGAERFSAVLAQRLQDAPPSTQKDAQNGWFNATGAAASRSVAPSSKRGS